MPNKPLVVGDLFDPHRQSCGFSPADVVARQHDLTDGQKRLYDRGVRWAGVNGRFWYGHEKIAQELGKSSRQVKRDMEALVQHGLILRTRKGKRLTNDYRFLYHQMFQSEVTPASPHPPGEVTDLSSEVTPASLGEVTSASPESCKKNSIRESSSGNASASAAPEAEEDRDDDSPSLNENQNQDAGLVDALGSSFHLEDGDPLLGEGPFPRWFLLAAAEKVHASRCYTGLGGPNLELCPAPDLQFVGKILEPWRGKGTVAFIDWVCNTAERGLGRKTKATGRLSYGLFLRDSIAHAATWKRDELLSREIRLSVLTAKAEASRRFEDERRRQIMAAKVSFLDATKVLDLEDPSWKRFKRERFLWLMEHRTSEISPDELLAAATAWRTCAKCNDSGMSGSPAKRTLAFCECEIGRQERVDRGDGYVAGEIARVQATFKSLLVQACRELKHDFTGDSVEQEDTRVVEHAGEVQFFPGKDADVFWDAHDLRRALDYLGDKRVARVMRSAPDHGIPDPPRNPIKQEDVARVLADLKQQQAPGRKEPASEASFDSPAVSTANLGR